MAAATASLAVLLAAPAAAEGASADGLRARDPGAFVCGSGPDLAARMARWHAEAQRRAPGGTEAATDFDVGNVAILFDGGNLVVSGFTDTNAIARQFYASHPDDFDYLAIFISSAYNTDVQIESGFAFHRRVASDVLGIGVDPVDNTAVLGLGTTRLRSLLQMNDLLEYLPRFDDELPQFGTGFEGVEILGHEAAHQFVAFAEVPGEGMLGRQSSHWSFFMNTEASVMEGNKWEQDGMSFTSTAAFETFSLLDEYLMGLRDESTVTEPIFVIQNPKQTGGRDATSSPEAGVTIRGDRRDVTMAEIIASEGSRVPAWDAAPSSFSMALVLVVPEGATVPPGDLERMESFRRTFFAWFRQETSGLATIDTALPGVTVAAGFEAERFAGAPPLTVAFRDRSTGPVSSWLWEFGDGATSTEIDPVHIYADPGFYTVRLTVDGAGGPDTLQRAAFVVVQPFVEELHDDFETLPGTWLPAGLNDAISGLWIQADPEGTVQSTVQAQPEDDLTPDPGALCWVTGAGLAGGQPGDDDVDAGTVTLQSPVFDLAGRVLPVIEFGLWFSNDLGGEPGGDEFTLQASPDGGSLWVELEATRRGDRLWRTHQVRLTDQFAPTDQVRFRLVVSDLGLPSLVEAAVDEFRVLSLTGFVDDDGDAIPDVIDNCPGLSNPPQFDVDADGFGNICDCDDTDPSIAVPAGEDVVLSADAADPDRVLWTPDPLADAYNVYRGIVEPGAGFAYSQSCLKGHTVLTEAFDFGVPAAGVYHFYLVAPENGCGEAGLGQASDGTPRPLSTPCPPPIGP